MRRALRAGERSSGWQSWPSRAHKAHYRKLRFSSTRGYGVAGPPSSPQKGLVGAKSLADRVERQGAPPCNLIGPNIGHSRRGYFCFSRLLVHHLSLLSPSFLARLHLHPCTPHNACIDPNKRMVAKAHALSRDLAPSLASAAHTHGGFGLTPTRF